MKNRRFWLPLVLWPALLSCEQAAKQQPGAARPRITVRAAAAANSAAAFVGYHRYRGTVGQQPVTADLTIGPTYANDSVRCWGTYYYDHQGGPLLLKSRMPWQPGKPLSLAETLGEAIGEKEQLTARWQAVQPIGPLLTGTWTSADGRRKVPFSLHEDYTGAVRYELLTENQEGEPCRTASEDGGHEHQLEAAREYLHLLGPDTLRPGLRALQCPPPAKRRAELLEELRGLGCEADNEKYGTYSSIEVMYNGDELLSLLQTESENLGGAYPLNNIITITYDLSTGKPCDVRTWLRADRAGVVADLFDHYLRADSIGQNYAPEENSASRMMKPKLADLPDFGLNSEGLYCTLGSVGAPHVVQRLPITIPYAALRTCVLPRSPLARLMKARRLLLTLK